MLSLILAMQSERTHSDPIHLGRKRVFIVEDHPIMRQGICTLLSLQSDLMVCGEAADAPTALDRIATAQPDIVVVDLTLKRGSGLELIKSLRFGWPQIRTLVLSMHDEADYLERVLRAGAGGFLAKDEAPDQIIEAVHKVLQGDKFLSPKAREYLRGRDLGQNSESARTSLNSLTDRELEVLGHIGKGIATRQIAAHLNISAKTVETYRASLKLKLGIKTASELVRYAVNWIEREARQGPGP
jgi:DNA-binding NarL/FixJ family response regulator